MLFKSQFAVGAFLLSVALGGAEIVNEGRNLRGESAAEQDERELMPWGYGQGYGYTTNSNRYTAPRTRGQVQGSAYLRPNPYNSLFNAYNPHDDGHGAPPASKSAKGPKSVTPRAPKGTKTGKAPGTGAVYAKSAKAAKYVSTPPAAPGVNNVATRPNRGSSYLNTMHWQRVPGQPIFVSATDVPIIIIDQQPEVVIDDEGNTILTDADGNEITVTINADGSPELTIETPAPTAAP